MFQHMQIVFPSNNNNLFATCSMLLTLVVNRYFIRHHIFPKCLKQILETAFKKHIVFAQVKLILSLFITNPWNSSCKYDTRTLGYRIIENSCVDPQQRGTVSQFMSYNTARGKGLIPPGALPKCWFAYWVFSFGLQSPLLFQMRNNIHVTHSGSTDAI